MQIDIEYIKQWVNITDEELMNRLVKDAVGLQKEAKEREQADIIAKRMADETYNIEFVRAFFCEYQYLSRFFKDDEILAACKHYAAKSNLAHEMTIRGHLDAERQGLRFVRYTRADFEEISRNGWKRTIRDDGTVILVPSQYQSWFAGDVAKELLLNRLPYLREYSVDVYSLGQNDWIYIKNPEKDAMYSTASLQVSAADLLTKQSAEKLLEPHRKYWHDYGHGIYDSMTEKFLDSEFVKKFVDVATR